ncbi:unnamed protein product [Acanthoscelides obtectus]|uniref:Uncharacterized protein n=1 Tax=Acanthoscelides obtectus TaxID=200917 RepID=A0A9P0JGD7_ACAOB|nr:unnamed protein product [Acanthoscelides obtectus]CAK1661416.1 hypothetical protein AOBTE_LOCUS22609 [Acanthoscelides obtectus]
MDKPRDKVFRRKDIVTRLPKQSSSYENDRSKENPRPKSRSVFTSSHAADDMQTRDILRYEGQLQRPYVPKPITVNNYFSEDYIDMYGDDGYNGGTGGTTISPHGVITMRLREHIRVDVSLDRAVRVINAKNGIILALSASGSSSGLVHPNGRVYQYGSRVEILANDAQENDKFAKMWYKGVSFTSMQCALVYLVDSAGTRTTTDSFSDLTHDFTLNIFYEDSPYSYIDTPNTTHATQLVNEAMAVLQSTTCWMTEDRTTNWIINNIRISQTSDGLVRVGRNSNKYSLRTSPTNGSASVSTPYMHCTGSMGQTRHLFVRRGERRMHYDGSTFIVRNAGHSAGFDEKHQLKVY